MQTVIKLFFNIKLIFLVEKRNHLLSSRKKNYYYTHLLLFVVVLVFCYLFLLIPTTQSTVEQHQPATHPKVWHQLSVHHFSRWGCARAAAAVLSVAVVVVVTVALEVGGGQFANAKSVKTLCFEIFVLFVPLFGCRYVTAWFLFNFICQSSLWLCFCWLLLMLYSLRKLKLYTTSGQFC